MSSRELNAADLKRREALWDRTNTRIYLLIDLEELRALTSGRVTIRTRAQAQHILDLLLPSAQEQE